MGLLEPFPERKGGSMVYGFLGDEKTHGICRVSSACLEEGAADLRCIAPDGGIRINWYKLHWAGFHYSEALLMQ